MTEEHVTHKWMNERLDQIEHRLVRRMTWVLTGAGIIILLALGWGFWANNVIYALFLDTEFLWQDVTTLCANSEATDCVTERRDRLARGLGGFRP